jgi:hypothetical protein
MIMQHRTASGHLDNEIHIDWESARSWIERARKEGILAEIGVGAAFLAILGWTVFAIIKAVQGYQVVGPGFF